VEPARVVTLKKTAPRTLGVLYPPKVKISKPKRDQEPIEGRSFPSGHTSNNFAVGVVLTAFYPRRGWLFFLMAAGISYSRIYTGSHWPTDVAASVVLGVGLGLLMVWACKNAWARWAGSVAPSLYRRHPHLLEERIKIAP
jgi:undecaprenyl-diphosphatase